MDANRRGGLAFPAVVGISVGVGSTAIRAFQENVGSPLGIVAGVTLTAVVAYVTALILLRVVARFSKPAK